MHVEYQEIEGWKWDSLEALSRDELVCARTFPLPLQDTDVTRIYIDPVEERDPISNILLFYYCAYTYPSPLPLALGDPIRFTIQVIHEP